MYLFVKDFGTTIWLEDHDFKFFAIY